MSKPGFATIFTIPTGMLNHLDSSKVTSLHLGPAMSPESPDPREPGIQMTGALRRYSALTLMTVHVSVHNGTLLADHFLDPHSIPRVLYSTNQFLIDIWVLVTMF